MSRSYNFFWAALRDIADMLLSNKGACHAKQKSTTQAN